MNASSAAAHIAPSEDAATTLARWEAEEHAARARMAPGGVATPDQLRGLTGLQWLEAIGRGELPAVTVSESMNLWPISVAAGRVVFQGRPDARYLNPMGTVHGGWIAALLDSAVGCVVLSTLPAAKGFTTVELKISYLRAIALPQTPLVRAEATIINAGRMVGFAEARLVGPDGKLYAHATTTCVVLDRP
ncbi:MAG: hypothetical protein RJA98_226 [Pseudomonadota bacterium]|jgi:uncharacterized protein (TIGR00369 family)